jgi:subtilisin family serine protease
MFTKSKTKVRTFLVVLIAIFSLSSTMVPTSAIDLGAKAKYIISVTPAAKAAVEAAVVKAGGKIQSRYNYVFDGFTIELPKLVASALTRIPNILTIEEDRDVLGLAIQNTQTPTPTWGIDRVDQREKVGLAGSTSAYGYRSAGAGATIYIGDTGIYPHSDLAGRISSSGYSSINDGNGTVDCNGHGTHVAATAAGTKYGLAKNARVVPVRLLNCAGSGQYSGVIAALDWILSPENPNPKTQAVLNLSIGGAGSAAMNAAILRLTNAGITVVAAAGNEATDACTRSPAGAPSAITVGATTSADQPATFSNQGSCVDLFAPGAGIVSAWIGDPDLTYTASGTSMASPHVAGAAAIYLGLNPGASVAQVASFLDAESTKNALSNLKASTVNKLLYVSPTDGGAPIVPPVVAQRSVTNITHESADVLIDVNPGFASTTLSFEYGVDPTFANKLTAPVVPGVIDGQTPTTATVKLAGLSALVTYSFRIIGVNESGRTVSQTGSFTTLAPPKIAPTATVSQATDITAYSATLNGGAQAGNDSTKVSFMYGTDPEFKANTNNIAANPFILGTGNTLQNVALSVSFLDGGKKYYYKVVAINSTGTTHSSVMTFDTPVAPGLPPTVVVSANPLSRAVSTAAFEAVINPKGQTTVVELIHGGEK